MLTFRLALSILSIIVGFSRESTPLAITVVQVPPVLPSEVSPTRPVHDHVRCND